MPRSGISAGRVAAVSRCRSMLGVHCGSGRSPASSRITQSPTRLCDPGRPDLAILCSDIAGASLIGETRYRGVVLFVDHDRMADHALGDCRNQD
jgi:hypothetical protein